MGEKGAKKLSPPEREAMILDHIPLVKQMVVRMMGRMPPHVESEDLMNAGLIGLIQAAEKYDPSKEIPFRFYAEARIRGALFDELRHQDFLPRELRREIKKLEEVCSRLESRLGRPPEEEEMAASLGMEMGSFSRLLDRARTISLINIGDLEGGILAKQQEKLSTLSREQTTDPLVQLNLEELRDILGKTIEQLPEKERLVITLYYYEELNLKEIGRVLDITESRASQIRAKALVRLRGKLRKWGVDGR